MYVYNYNMLKKCKTRIYLYKIRYCFIQDIHLFIRHLVLYE